MWRRQPIQSQVNEALAVLQTDGVRLTMPELLAYREQSRHLSFSLKPKGYLAGNFLSRSKGRGMEFDEVRQYQHGDDIRSIDWRVTARTGKPHTKLFREELERPVLIACDMSPTMNFGSRLLFKSVQAGHLAALLAWQSVGSGDRLGGLVFNSQQHVELKPASRQKAVLTFLHALIEGHDENRDIQQDFLFSNLSANLSRLRVLAKPGSLVYVISDFYSLDEDGLNSLSQIARHCELVCCQVTDPLEHSLPLSATKLVANLTNGQQTQQVLIGDNKSQLTYKRARLSQHNVLQDRLKQIRARQIVQISAAEPLAKQLEAIWTR